MTNLDGWLWKRKDDITRIAGETSRNPKYRQEHRKILKRVQMS